GQVRHQGQSHRDDADRQGQYGARAPQGLLAARPGSESEPGRSRGDAARHDAAGRYDASGGDGAAGGFPGSAGARHRAAEEEGTATFIATEAAGGGQENGTRKQNTARSFRSRARCAERQETNTRLTG